MQAILVPTSTDSDGQAHVSRGRPDIPSSAGVTPILMMVILYLGKSKAVPERGQWLDSFVQVQKGNLCSLPACVSLALLSWDQTAL